jgi:hypothetical protein
MGARVYNIKSPLCSHLFSSSPGAAFIHHHHQYNKTMIDLYRRKPRYSVGPETFEKRDLARPRYLKTAGEGADGPPLSWSAPAADDGGGGQGVVAAAAAAVIPDASEW